MSATAIRAGKAWVELSVQDKVDAGLKRAQAKFLAWGRGLTQVGAMITASAGAILGAMTLAAKSFADVGSEIHDMSIATGVGAESLSALTYAVSQSGGSIDSLKGGLRALAKFTLQVSQGNKTATKTLSELGISAAAFLAASPEERLGLIADALMAVEDPGIRAGYAMKLLGKGAEGLLPAMADGSKGLAEMTAQAREFNLTWTDADTKKADELGDAWGLLGAVWERIVSSTGGALADTLTFIIMATAKAGAGLIEFIQNNKTLVAWVTAAAAISAAAGIAFLAMGGAAVVLSVMLTGASAALALYNGLATYAAVVTAIFASPIFLVGAAIVGLIALLASAAIAWLLFTESGQTAFTGILAGIKELAVVAGKTFKGITDALMSGNWALAGKIAMAGLNVAMVMGLNQIRGAWASFQAWLLRLFADLGQALGKFMQKAGTTLSVVADGVRASGVPGSAAAAGGLSAVGNDLKRGGIASSTAADGLRSKADDIREDAQVKAELALAIANAELALAVADAASAREAGAPQSPPSPGGGGGDDGTPVGPGAASGTFSAALASNIGSTADTIQEQIANNTAKGNEHLEKIERMLEEGMPEVSE